MRYIYIDAKESLHLKFKLLSHVMREINRKVVMKKIEKLLHSYESYARQIHDGSCESVFEVERLQAGLVARLLRNGCTAVVSYPYEGRELVEVYHPSDGRLLTTSYRGSYLFRTSIGGFEVERG